MTQKRKEWIVAKFALPPKERFWFTLAFISAILANFTIAFLGPPTTYLVYAYVTLSGLALFFLRGGLDKLRIVGHGLTWALGLLGVIFFRLFPDIGLDQDSPIRLVLASVLFTICWIPLGILQDKATSFFQRLATAITAAAALGALSAIIIPILMTEELRSFTSTTVNSRANLIFGNVENFAVSGPYGDTEQIMRRNDRNEWESNPINHEGVVVGYRAFQQTGLVALRRKISDESTCISLIALGSSDPESPREIWRGPTDEVVNRYTNRLSPRGRFFALRDGSVIDISLGHHEPTLATGLKQFSRLYFINWNDELDIFYLLTNTQAVVEVDPVADTVRLLADQVHVMITENIAVNPEGHCVAYLPREGDSIIIKQIDGEERTQISLSFPHIFSEDVMTTSYGNAIEKNARLTWLDGENLVHVGSNGVLYRTNIPTKKSTRLTPIVQPVRSVIWNPDTRELVWTTILSAKKTGIHYRKLSL